VSQQPVMTAEEISEAKEHRDMILDLRGVLNTQSGRNVFKYLFKHLEVAELPELGWTGELLSDKLGSLRAGQSIFKLVCEADAEMAGSLLAKVEKEKYARLNKRED